MARKRKVESDSDSGDDDASYEPKRARADDDDWYPPKKSRGKSKSKRRDTLNVDDITDESSLAPCVQNLPHAMSLHVITRPAPLQEALMGWYEGVQASRGMPWRKPFDPAWDAEQKAQRAYEVWVSEIMLQQTQVATVIPYYNRWMDKFPTIRDLAASDIDTVNGLWKGLGYYSRAARLLSGAQKAVREFGGRLPDNAQDMESKIPGIGRYSAGAICSIAYNQCVSVLDGNVHRLLSRFLALHAPPKAKPTLDVLWAGASAFVSDADRPGDLNQALIELGSTVCKVRDPTCANCPLQRWCAAYERQQSEGKERNGKTHPEPSTSSRGEGVPDIEELCSLCEPLSIGSPVTSYPMKPEKKKAREELDIVNVVEWRRESTGQRWFLLVRRPAGGLLAGLHEFPTVPDVPVTTSPSAQVTIADTLLSALLVSPPPAASRSTRSAEQSDGQTQASRRRSSKPSTDTQSPSGLRVAKIAPAGEVLHVFSHIRKTYRVQWVLLEGGTDAVDGPPALVRSPDLGKLGDAKPKTSRGEMSRKNRANASAKVHAPTASTLPAAQTTQWVPLDAVADANIGTGVMKIWRQVCALWEDGEAARNGGGEDDN